MTKISEVVKTSANFHRNGVDDKWPPTRSDVPLILFLLLDELTIVEIF
jgi:hypothetical protein